MTTAGETRYRLAARLWQQGYPLLLQIARGQHLLRPQWWGTTLLSPGSLFHPPGLMLAQQVSFEGTWTAVQQWSLSEVQQNVKRWSASFETRDAKTLMFELRS
jgi:hypothetical protein